MSLGRLQPLLELTARSSVSQLLWRRGAVIPGRAPDTAAAEQSASPLRILDPLVQQISTYLFLQWILDPVQALLPVPLRPAEATARRPQPVWSEPPLPLQPSPLPAQMSVLAYKPLPDQLCS